MTSRGGCPPNDLKYPPLSAFHIRCITTVEYTIYPQAFKGRSFKRVGGGIQDIQKGVDGHVGKLKKQVILL